MIILFIVLILCEDKCSMGSSMCSNNMLSICDENGHWVTTDCPDDTECNTKNNSMACIPNTNEKGKSSRIDDSKMMEQLLKLTKDKQFVKRLKDELQKDNEEVIDSENETEDTDSDNKEEDQMSNQEEDYESEEDKKQKTHFKMKDKSLSIKKPSKKGNLSIKKLNKQKQDKKSKPNKGKNIVKIVKGDHPKKPKTKDNNEEIKEEPQKVKTVTYHKLDQTDKDKDSVTVTVYKTIIQKENKDESNQKKKDDKELTSSVEAFKYQIPGSAKVNINLFTRPIEDKKDTSSDKKVSSYQKSSDEGKQQLPIIEVSQKPAGGGGQKPAGGGDHKPTGGGDHKPAGGGDQKPAGGGGQKPAGGGDHKPAGGGDHKPAGGGDHKPANGSGQKPANGSGQKPANGSGQKPAGGGDHKPAGGGDHKPAGGGDHKPAGGGGQKPAGGGDHKPAGGGGQKPANGSSQKPVGGGNSEKPPASGTSSNEKKSSTDKKDSTSQDKSSKSGSNNSSSQNKSSGGGALNITSDQINEAIGTVGYTSKPEYVDAVVKITNEEFSDINMAAMFLAQLAHESGGFQHMEEVDCAGSTKCADQYGGSEGAPGKSYHGRGFIQLSWPANYKEAGEGLGMGDQLFENPDMILEDPELGAKVSVWFWKSRVETAPGVSEFKFGATTKAINGALECTGSNIEQSKKRYEFYKAIAGVLGVTDLASEDGCY